MLWAVCERCETLTRYSQMIGLDGIALINIVGNADEAVLTGRKALQSRITHNDGGTWKPLNPPPVDSFGNKYECQSTVREILIPYQETILTMHE